MFVVKMVLKNVTKGAVRYEGIGDDSPSSPSYKIGTLYIRKSAFTSEQYPETITVEVR